MSFDLSLEEGKFLVNLARKAVEEYLKNGKKLEVPEKIDEKLLQPCGVFVTINKVCGKKRELRGCIGYPYPTTPLVEAIIDSAISSAVRDPRFHPLSPKELGKVVFEISVLTPPQIIEAKKPDEYPKKIKIGRDGLIVEKGVFKGLLLPQVPVEWKWDEEEFLCQCCVKAGLPPDCWLLNGTKIYKFQAIIFEEEKPGGEVKR
ncbi:MAG TPA: TIGR00296 family protein, partial [Candidatus Bathyarchaeota archaeon]|nr:TIGR00296 family protein [Candidatus Bathyarchaeota archaeon]